MKKYRFPEIKTIEIRNFSLFRKRSRIVIDLQKDVFCLAGANGLGKSTFVTIVNYALTGIVKNPERDFTWYNSIPAFYAKSKSFASDYFDGRVSESDRNLAEVKIRFELGSKSYELTRGFFEPEELRQLVIVSNGQLQDISTNLSPYELEDHYKDCFVKDVGLTDFDQFVFLQSFVFTFDETHQLLFWDASLIERVLHLFFGLDSEKAKQADLLRKSVSKHDSDARNLQWQITKARNELNGIKEKLSDKSKESVSEKEVFERHEALLRELDDQFANAEKLGAKIKDTETQIADSSLRLATLRSEYEKIFNQRSESNVPIEHMPQISALLKKLYLQLSENADYGETIEELIEVIKKRLREERAYRDKDYLKQLKAVDEQLHKLTLQVRTHQDKKERQIEEERLNLIKINEIKDKITQIEQDNEELIKQLRRGKDESGISSLIDSYREQIDRYSRQKDKSKALRDRGRKELRKLEDELSIQYNEAESKFIPIFNSYANSFLGLEIDIRLSVRAKATTFSLDINSSERREAYQLSESQRYFIDIALRMALIELGSKNCSLLIDTPEGSLDIAYESRAGKMFADFTKKGYRLLITANINSSQMLLQLAKICKSEKMQIERMTEWTLLSDVQQQESQIIEEAFEKIDSTLKSKI